MKRGRPPHVPTDKDRQQVEAMAGHGVPELDIARVIGINAMTLRKWYSQELQTGHIKANSMVAQSLYKKAMGNGQGAVAACIFWLKCRAGWSEYAPSPLPPPLGKKEQAQIDAVASAKGTEWGHLVH
jgi:hypothetical protein